MRIGVISDTHGDVQAWRRATERFDGSDLILHAGDVLYHPPRIPPGTGYDTMGLADLINSSEIPVVIARGNVDPEVCEEILRIPAMSPYAFVEFGGLRIVVTHGHTLTADSLGALAERYCADVLVTGHTHIPVVERIGRAIHVNPGSPAHPKFEHGGKATASVGLISDGAVRVVELESGEEIASLRL